ncbi:unnamed protein product [Dicrocoelium dendriticum]|nr:unnamed protein product [Dicrocoelium dendriticum]
MKRAFDSWPCYRYAIILITWFALGTHGSTFGTDKQSGPVEQRQCLKPVPIQIPECRNTFYNFTGMPNLVDQDSQLDARQQLQTFKPLIVYQCSKKLSFFLCSVYTPMCDVITRHLIGPCRPLCEHVKARCAPVLRVFDFDWPTHLNCSRFPVKNVIGGTMCMEGPYDPEERTMTPDEKESDLDPNAPFTSSVSTSPSVHHSMSHLNSHSKVGTVDSTLIPEERILGNWIQQVTQIHNDDPSNSDLAHLPPSSISVIAKSLRHCSHLRKPTSYVYINRTGRCAPLCWADILYKRDAKLLSIVWTSVVTVSCCFTTCLALIGYAIDSDVFQLAERPVFYIALCHLIHSIAFAISLAVGRESATCGKDLDSGLLIRLQEGLDNSICALIFMTQFFFSLASSVWWVLLSLHWVASQRPSRCSQYRTYLESLNLPNSYRESTLVRAECPRRMGAQCDFSTNQSSPENSVKKMTDEFLGHKCVKNDRSEKLNGSAIYMHSDTTIPPVSAPTVPARSISHPSEVTPYFVHNGRVVPSYRYLYLRGNSRHYTTATDRLSAWLAREHIVVWLTASLFTVGVLVSRQVDADELVPVCGVGRQNARAMGAFVIGPQVTLIVIGTLALLGGMVMTVKESARRRRNAQDTDACTRSGELQTSDVSRLLRNSPVSTAVEQNQQTPAKCVGRSHSEDNSQRFAHRFVMDTVMWQSTDGMAHRLGLFCFLYLIPALCVISCDIYEYLHRDKWLRDTSHSPSLSDQGSNIPFPPKIWKSDETVGPTPEIFMLRVFMSLVPGFTCNLWIWSSRRCRPLQRLQHTIKSLLLSCKNFCLAFKSGKFTVKSKTNIRDLTFQFPPAEPHTPTTSSAIIPRPPFALSSYPYAVYQYHASLSSRDPLDRAPQSAWSTALDPCVVQTAATTNTLEMQHSNATTPGYYSQAKVGSIIEPNQSDSFSEESPIPPPLPASSRPQRLPLRAEK